MPLIKRWNFPAYTLSVSSIIVRILPSAERLVENIIIHITSDGSLLPDDNDLITLSRDPRKKITNAGSYSRLKST